MTSERQGLTPGTRHLDVVTAEEVRHLGPRDWGDTSRHLSSWEAKREVKL